MKALRIGVALACGAVVGACAIQPSTTPSAVVTSPRAKVVAAPEVKDAVAIGKSTKADVTAALGETLVIRFDNGYEVWVYRLVEDRRGEFVILFEPDGVVAKTRIRR
jgi:hypothetical protein